MASPVILTAGKIQLDPSARVLKARDYAEYLQAQEVISQANRQAEEILQKAAKVYESKKQQGYDEGREISKQEQSEHMLKVVSRTIGYLSDVEKALAGILMSGIKKIIGEFDSDEMAVNLVRNALQHVRNEKQVTIRIPPSQFNMVKSRVNEILAEYKGVGFIDLVSDERLSTGDCIMESDIGVVDASVDLQLEALQKRFEKLNSEAVSNIARDTTMLE